MFRQVFFTTALMAICHSAFAQEPATVTQNQQQDDVFVSAAVDNQIKQLDFNTLCNKAAAWEIDALNELGRRYEYSHEGLTQDFSLAYGSYQNANRIRKEAAGSVSVKAVQGMARIAYISNLNGMYSREEAHLLWAELAAQTYPSLKQETSQELSALGDMHLFMLATRLDPMQAHSWYTQALKKDAENHDALYGLGILHMQGHSGVEQDFDKSLRFLTSAKEFGHPKAEEALQKLEELMGLEFTAGGWTVPTPAETLLAQAQELDADTDAREQQQQEQAAAATVAHGQNVSNNIPAATQLAPLKTQSKVESVASTIGSAVASALKTGASAMWEATKTAAPVVASAVGSGVKTAAPVVASYAWGATKVVVPFLGKLAWGVVTKVATAVGYAASSVVESTARDVREFCEKWIAWVE